ncbi:hypothetical protein GCK32_004963 [Trichostrongylus colubriformis]|uniref:SMAUG/ZCCHC2-like PHAT domain-containing protein n=1 Tax=Trichostrongylus colubriformis TaxID=6319 RepID=A0AAN8FP17_TRICO
MPNNRRKKSGGFSARRDSSTQKESSTAAATPEPTVDGREASLNGITGGDDVQPPMNGCVARSSVLNGSLAASSQTESSDVESLSSDSSRRNTMSSSGGDRDAARSCCKNNQVVERELVRDMSQSYSLTSQVDYGSDECAVRTPEDAYPCCSSSEAVGGGASEASSTPTMRQHETRSNCPQFISTMATEMSQVPYALKVEAAYNVVCLLNSANRQGAHALIRLVDHLMTMREMELELLSSDEARKDVLINLGKLVSASIHHPAFSVDQRIRMVHARDEIRRKLEQIAARLNPPVIPSSTSNEQKSTSTVSRVSPLAGGFAFVRRFHATQPDVNDPDNFLVEMIWSDGERTFVGRTRNDINTLHHRLLDMFGEERREMKQNQDAETERPESASSSRTPSPTATDSNATPTPAFGTSALRILPYFSMDCSPAAVIQYINALSDLPARMMLSSVIYEQFFASRLSSEELEVAERPIRTASPTLQRYTHPASAPPTFPVASAALSYSSRGMGIQVQFPSCSNCAGPHAFVQCTKDTPLQKDGVFRLDFGGGVHDSTCPNCSAVAMTAAAIGPRPTGVEHFPNLPPGLMPPPAMMPLVPGMPILARHFSPYVFHQTPPPTSQPHPHL